MTPPRAATLACALVVASLHAPHSAAQASPPAPTAAADPATPLAHHVAQLNNPDYAQRAAATDALLLHSTLDLSQLARAAGHDLAPEARQRLLYIAHHHTVQRLRHTHFPAQGAGSIGILQSVLADPLPPAPARPGARTAPPPRVGPTYALVTGVLPGFPACGKLRPLDRIVALDGEDLAGPAVPNAFQSLLAPYAAQDTITLTVIRDGTTRNVSLTLANRAALSGIYAPPNHTLHPRFAQEWDVQRKHFDWPADGGLTPTGPVTPGPQAAPAPVSLPPDPGLSP